MDEEILPDCWLAIASARQGRASHPSAMVFVGEFMPIPFFILVAATLTLFGVYGAALAVSPQALFRWHNKLAKRNFFAAETYRAGAPKLQAQLIGVVFLLSVISTIGQLLDRVVVRTAEGRESTPPLAVPAQNDVLLPGVIGIFFVAVGVGLLIEPVKVFKILTPGMRVNREFYELDKVPLMLSIMGLALIVLGSHILKALVF